MDYRINTTVHEGLIAQEVTAPGLFDDLREVSSRRIVDTLDQQAIEALKQLGWTPPSKPIPPVEGDLLPPIGSKVLIHLASCDEWVEHEVVGYYVWPELRPGMGYRVNVRVRDKAGYLNARALKDVRPAETK